METVAQLCQLFITFAKYCQDLDLGVNENNFPRHKGIFEKPDTEPQSKFLLQAR